MKNPSYEQALARQGVTFTYHESISLEDIDLGKGLRNQARLITPIDSELVEQYAAAMKDGSQFPPVVLWRHGRGRWVPVDGNNRLAAMVKAEKNQTDAYVIECGDPMIVDRVTWTFNNHVNGKRLSREECIEHAVSFVLKYGATNKQAAQEWGVPLWQVQRSVKISQVRSRLQAQDVKLTKALTDEHIHRLGPLESVGEDVLATAAGVVAVSGVSPEECEALVKDVKAAKTHEAKAKVVEDFANSDLVKQKRAETKSGRVLPPRPQPRMLLQRLVRQGNKLYEDYGKDGLTPPKTEYKQARGEAADFVQRLNVIFNLGSLLDAREVS